MLFIELIQETIEQYLREKKGIYIPTSPLSMPMSGDAPRRSRAGSIFSSASDAGVTRTATIQAELAVLLKIEFKTDTDLIAEFRKKVDPLLAGSSDLKLRIEKTITQYPETCALHRQQLVVLEEIIQKIDRAFVVNPERSIKKNLRALIDRNALTYKEDRNLFVDRKIFTALLNYVSRGIPINPRFYTTIIRKLTDKGFTNKEENQKYITAFKEYPSATRVEDAAKRNTYLENCDLSTTIMASMMEVYCEAVAPAETEKMARGGAGAAATLRR